jgi:hypothetical protein
VEMASKGSEDGLYMLHLENERMPRQYQQGWSLSLIGSLLDPLALACRWEGREACIPLHVIHMSMEGTGRTGGVAGMDGWDCTTMRTY